MGGKVNPASPSSRLWGAGAGVWEGTLRATYRDTVHVRRMTWACGISSGHDLAELPGWFTAGTGVRASAWRKRGQPHPQRLDLSPVVLRPFSWSPLLPAAIRPRPEWASVPFIQSKDFTNSPVPTADRSLPFYFSPLAMFSRLLGLW